MKNQIKNIHVNYSEYCYFDYLSGPEGLNYFFQLFDGQSAQTNIDLNGFFTQINNDYIDDDPIVKINTEIPDQHNRVDIMIDDEYILVESNSLKAIKLVMTRFIESGLILTRNKKSENMFKPDKTTRYLRVFSIIGQTPGICLS